MNKFAVLAALVALTSAHRHHHHRADPYVFVRVADDEPDAGAIAKAAAAEDAAKKEKSEEEAKMAEKDATDKKMAMERVYFDGNAWASEMPEHLLSGSGAAPLKHANLNQMRRLNTELY